MDHERMRRLHGGKRSGGNGSGFEKITHTVALVSKSSIARDTWLFRFEKPDGFTYRAGQHVRMSLLNPKAADPAGHFRFWSFASAPFEPDLAFAVRMRPSPFKTELAGLPVGAQVRIDMLKNAPHGAFALDDTATPVVFLAGGIGVVPAWSMIKQALHEGSTRRMTLLYGNRSPEDAPFLDELTSLAREHDHFHFAPTLTGPLPYAWAGETGRISLEMVRRYVPDHGVPAFYISGLKGMVEDLTQALVRAGVPKASIRSEEFGTFTPGRRLRTRQPFGLASLAGIALIAMAALAVHLAPVWWLTAHHPLAWLGAHPVPAGAAAVILGLIVVKLGIFLALKRRGRRPH
jgi:ferredoxin-NADP reductase